MTDEQQAVLIDLADQILADKAAAEERQKAIDTEEVSLGEQTIESVN